MAAWKDLEERIEGIEASDFVSLDATYRTELPTWLEDAVTAAVAKAGLAKAPAALVFSRGRPAGDSLVILRLSDFEYYFGDEKAKT